jgi:hypothetical protein
MKRYYLLAATAIGLLVSEIVVGFSGAASPAAPASPSAFTARVSSLASSAQASVTINIDGVSLGPVFAGLGAISGNGTSRLLIDYPEPERSAILDELFTPDEGASIEDLKLEIGADGNGTNGADPSDEHTPGHIDRDSYEFWLARQAVLRNPHIVLYALQWGAPSWVGYHGSLWAGPAEGRDIKNVLDWLGVAKSWGLRFSYLGGWNETGFNASWFVRMREALNTHGYAYIQLVAADAPPTRHQLWAEAKAMKPGSAVRRAVSVVGDHDPAGAPTTGYACTVSQTARSLHKPLWLSEVGHLPSGSGAAALIRTVNRCYIEGGLTGYYEWPLAESMASGFAIPGRGLITADQPWSGHYTVDRLLWATAQTTQFARPGWHYINSASRNLGNWGSSVAYAAPHNRAWSAVIENTGTRARQRLSARTVTIQLSRLPAGHVTAWATNLWSSNPKSWFIRWPVTASGNQVQVTVPAGYVVSVTTSKGQSHGTLVNAPARTESLPYTVRPDGAHMPWGMSPADGAFEVVGGWPLHTVIRQLAVGRPVLWGTKSTEPRHPFAVAGVPSWRDYTVSAKVRLGGTGRWAGLIGRYGNEDGNGHGDRFSGYELRLYASGTWVAYANHQTGRLTLLASGVIPRLKVSSWYQLSLRFNGHTMTVRVAGQSVSVHIQRTTGLAGIESSWAQVQFADFTVVR